MVRGPVGLQLPVDGSYTSALARGTPLLPYPPATRTLPLERTLAVWSSRAVVIIPVLLHTGSTSAG